MSSNNDIDTDSCKNGKDETVKDISGEEVSVFVPKYKDTDVGGQGRVPQEPLPDDLFKKVKPIVDLSLINPDDEEFRQEILQFETKYHAAVIALILNIVVEKSVKDVNTLSKSLVHLVTTNTISPENFEAGLKETLYMAPDHYIDIPKFYDNIGIILAPHIEKMFITLAKTFDLCVTVIAVNQGRLLLKAIIHNLKERKGRTFVKAIWQESGLRLSQWMNEEQELYKKFRGILNKLTAQKFDTLLKKVLELDIDSQKRMEGVIDLLYEKAIEEPNFSEVYANMCLKLSSLRVASDNNSDHVVRFRGLIISKCQTQFENWQLGKTDEKLMKLEKESAETADPAKIKELEMMINEQNRKIKLRAAANVIFIGELYKLKMLTCKIMDYCMRRLIDPLEEKNLERLCKLLTTIGEQLESDSGSQLDSIFIQMQEIVKRKSNQISSRVKFMIQDVLDLRRRKWRVKIVVDSQPKMMDQIQKMAEQQQRHNNIKWVKYNRHKSLRQWCLCISVGGRGRVCVPRPPGVVEANTPQEPLPDDLFKKVKPIVDLSLINPDDEEFRHEILEFETKYHAAVIALIINILVEKSTKDVNTLTKSLVHLVTTNTVSPENFEAGLKETLYMAPDHYIDIPKLYENFGIILAPHIEKKHITLAKTFDLCGSVIAADQGHLLLKAIIHNLKESKGRTFVNAIWQESGLRLSEWMNKEQLMNAGGEYSDWFCRKDRWGSSRFRHDDGGRNKRGGNSPQHSWKDAFPRPTYDLRRQAGSNKKNLANIRLVPPQWTSPKSQQGPASRNLSISTNMYSVLEKVKAEPTSLKVGGRGRVCVPRSRGVDANDDLVKNVKPIVHLLLINPDDEEIRQEILRFEKKYHHAAVTALILNILVETSDKDLNTLSKSLVHLVTTKTISLENFEAGLKETLYMAPDHYIDIPKFYDNIGIILAPHIENKHITLAKTFDLCGIVIAANQGRLLLKAIIHNWKNSKGPAFVKAIWQESGLRLSQWMNEEQVPKWVADSKFEFLGDAGTRSHYQANPVETQSRLSTSKDGL